MEFFSKLGFSFNPQFTDDTAACMIVSDDIYVMLLTHPKFKTFTPREICDTAKTTEVLVCLSSASRSEVDEMVRKARATGGTTSNESQGYGFMYGHGFQDLDGHIWELAFMEQRAIKKQAWNPTENEIYEFSCFGGPRVPKLNRSLIAADERSRECPCERCSESALF